MPNDTARQHAGVHFPPPLIYLLGLVAGWALDRWIPWPITAGRSRVRLALEVILILAYIALFSGAFMSFRRARTTLIPNRAATTVVDTGPYRWTRNPMYLSLTALFLAAALWLNTWWAIVLLIVVVVVIDRAVIAREERYLASAFPSEYESYRSRVRRWF